MQSALVAGTVGRAQGTVKVTILNNENQEVPTGKIGEVCIRGPVVTKGYINRPEANEEAFAGLIGSISMTPSQPFHERSLLYSES